MGARVRLAVLLVAWCLACGAAAASTSPARQTLVRVNGQNISEIMLKVYALSKTGRPLARLSKTVRRELLEALISTSLLAQEGSRLKTTAALTAGRELANMRYLSTVDVAHFMQTHKFSAQRVKAEYDRLVAARTVQQYQLLQILLPDMAAGERVRALLAQGVPFAHAVSLYSHDPISRPKGGDLGWLSQPVAVPYVANALEMNQVLRIASDLRIGGISEPFANSFGVHIIMLLATKPLPLAAVKARIKGILMQQSLIAHTVKLRAAAHVTQLAHP